MNRATFLCTILVGLVAFGIGCGGGNGGSLPSPRQCEEVIPNSECDDSKRPIVFIHGTYGSATEISKTALRFGSNGYCQERFVAVEYNSVPVIGESPLPQLRELIDQVREDTGFEKVDLMGHSQGTGHACDYLSSEENRAKVAHYVNISGGCSGNGVPTLSLSSENDLGGTPNHSSGPMVEQVTLEQEDHVALSGSKEAFVAMYEYLRDEEPEYTEVKCGAENVTISGKAVTFGDNVPQTGGRLEVFRIDDYYPNKPRERGEPIKTIEIGDNGHIETELKRNVQYEFRGLDPEGNLIGYTYFGPFRRSNYLLRVLGPPEADLVASTSTDMINRSPDHAAYAARYIGGAFRHDWNNSLKIDEQEILTPENAGESASVVGLFMYDDNENKETDLGQVFSVSFLTGTDVYVDSSEPRWTEWEWTNEDGKTTVLEVPNWRSSEALVNVNLP